MERYLMSKHNVSPVQSSASENFSNSNELVTEDSSSTGVSPKKRKVYSGKFNKEWEHQFKWLSSDNNNKAYCNAYNKTITTNIAHIKRHGDTMSHKSNVHITSTTPSIETFAETRRLSALQKEAKRSELKIIMFLHEHNLPFYVREHFPQFLKSVVPDSDIVKEIKCSRTKSTDLTKVIVKASLDTVTSEVNNKLYSLIVDETTDIATHKSLAILIRYFDDNCNTVEDKFLSLLKLDACNADSLFQGIVGVLEKNKIPINNMIGFAADNAAVMMGNRGGVQAKLQEINNNIFVLGCTCHSMHWSASAAASKLPKSVEEFSRNVFNHFSNSSNRSGLLEKFQVFCNTKPVKMLHPSQTRWLSLQAVVERLLRSWDALKLYFTNIVLEDNLNSNQNILECLQTPIVKAYLFFLSYILDIINRLNLEFQSETPKIHNLLPNIKTLYKTVLRNFIKVDILAKLDINDILPSDPHNFVTLNEVYCGAKVEQFLDTIRIPEAELQKFRKNILAFYIEASLQIKTRFNFNDKLLNYLTNFDPKMAVSGKVTSIIKILSFFPQINVDDIEALNAEWRLLPDIEVLKESANTMNFMEFWEYIFAMKNELKQPPFPNLSLVVKVLMSLPHSSACAERIFSQLTAIKTKKRNKLLVDTCDSILHCKQALKPNNCFNWEPSEKLITNKIHYRD